MSNTIEIVASGSVWDYEGEVKRDEEGRVTAVNDQVIDVLLADDDKTWHEKFPCAIVGKFGLDSAVEVINIINNEGQVVCHSLRYAQPLPPRETTEGKE